MRMEVDSEPIQIRNLLKLDIAQRNRFTQRSKRVAGWHKLVRHIALKPCIRDSFTNSCPIQFLCRIKLMPARHSACMVMGNEFMVFTDVANNVAFHDLHMIDVIKQLHALRTDSFDYLQSER